MIPGDVSDVVTWLKVNLYSWGEALPPCRIGTRRVHQMVGCVIDLLNRFFQHLLEVINACFEGGNLFCISIHEGNLLRLFYGRRASLLTEICYAFRCSVMAKQVQS